VPVGVHRELFSRFHPVLFAAALGDKISQHLPPHSALPPLAFHSTVPGCMPLSNFAGL